MTRKILILAVLAALGALAALSIPSSGRATDWSELSGLGYGVSQTVIDLTCTRVTTVTGYGPGTVSGDLGCTTSPDFQAAVDSFVSQTCHVAVFSEKDAPCAQPLPTPPATTTASTTTASTVPAPAPAPTVPTSTTVAPTDSTTTAPSPAPALAPTATDATVSSPASTATETAAPTAATVSGPTTADLQAQIDELRASIATVTAELHRLVCALQTWGPTMDPAILATMMSVDSTCA